MNGLQSPALHFTPSTSNWKFYLRRYLEKPKIRISGFKFSMWSILGGSVVLGLVSFCSGIAYSMDGFHILLDDHSRVGLSGASDFEEDQHTFLAFAKKIMSVLFLVATVFTNWDHPVKLAAKLTVILLSSKPSPSSVYFIIEKWRDQYMRQHPLWYKFKPLYAKQVEVEFYKFLCMARVELQDQKFTLIGIMGNWRVLQLAPCLETFSVLGNKAVNNFIRIKLRLPVHLHVDLS